MRRLRFAGFAVACLGALSGGMLYGAEDAASRLETSAKVFEEIMATPDKGIPQDLLAKSECVVIVPGMKKGAFVVGANYGRGFMTCRLPSGGWSAPAGLKIEGGSFGFQIGGSETDVVMLVMNKRGAEKLLSSKFTLGGDASVAGGPVGRTASAQTDAQLHAEILSYSRARGAFAGVSLQGASVRPDEDANAELYGKKLTNDQVVKGTMKVPPSGAKLLADLKTYSGRPAEKKAE